MKAIAHSSKFANNELLLPTADFEKFVVELAKKHKVTYKKTFADEWADAVTRLSDDEVKTDYIQDLLVALKRAGKISGKDMVAILVSYLREKRNVRPI